ncbi:HopJ type III effector protein [Photobacterium lipolyticum]|uniref:Type III effector n=1 Tax=Photobacterium lipolyticum TaxID=266810 RepID=A0A2T3MYZ2_9GAMM|nr:HopJ type III effector protein [Photobacterium lipolyticum]PSW05168.1 type III effector [Photobacterium lipolyticum]
MDALFSTLKNTPESVGFDTVIDTINEHYDYQPTAFSNGLGNETLANPAGTNEGSCRIFAFAKRHELSEAETLACFGKFYRIDVLENPSNDDHLNIRNFMKYGWLGIRFAGDALLEKKRR